MKSKPIPKNNIRRLRMERGLLGHELAKMIGTTSSHMSRLENSKQKLEIEWLEKIANALRVSASEIIDLPFDKKFTDHCDDVLLGKAIEWLLEASKKHKVKLPNKNLSKWASYVYKEALKERLDYKQTRYLAYTVIKVMKEMKG